MDNLKERLKCIDSELISYKKIENEEKINYSVLNDKLDKLVGTHNTILRERNSMKIDFESKMKDYVKLRKEVNEYKAKQETLLLRQYEIVIKNNIEEANNLPFKLNSAIFKDFDTLSRINSQKFPIFDRKKKELIDVQRLKLKEYIYEGLSLPSIEDKMYYCAILSNYETYFKDPIFVSFLVRKIQLGFDYHFRSNRETNRLDKPEWVFDYLIKELDNAFDFYEIYSEAADTVLFSFTEFIEECLKLVNLKVQEIIDLKSDQKRNLLLHLATEYNKFSSILEQNYNYTLSSDKIGKAITVHHLNYLKLKLDDIHRSNYQQWFKKYKKLISSDFKFMSSYSFICKDIRIEDLVALIATHIRNYVDELRFVNREEIRIIGFFYVEVEEFKEFILKEENEFALSDKEMPDDMIGKSLEILADLNAESLNLLFTMAENDAEKLLRQLTFYSYSSSEAKSSFIVETLHVLSDYKDSGNYKAIQRAVAEKIDYFIFEEIILKESFTSETFLDFNAFIDKLRSLFTDYEWNCIDGCNVLTAIFEGRKMQGQLFNKLSKKYYQ